MSFIVLMVCTLVAKKSALTYWHLVFHVELWLHLEGGIITPSQVLCESFKLLWPRPCAFSSFVAFREQCKVLKILFEY